MLKAQTQQGEPAQSELDGVVLMAGERLQSLLGAGKGDASRNANKVVLHLTDRRVIRISGAGNKQSTTFAAIEDISAVELTRQPPEGYGAFVWAGLAFFVSVMLWRIIERPVISITAAVVVALLGVYLIIDRLTLRGEHVLVVKAGGAEIRTELRGDSDQSDAEALIKRLFELKEERSAPRYSRANTFSPR